MTRKKYCQPLSYLTLLLMACCTSFAQQQYQYSVDLTKVANDQLQVNLVTPSIREKEIHFYLPKIVPGTYMNSNYGKYVLELQAYDESGKQLPVSRYGDNGWTITNADRLHHLNYLVEDTWDSKIDNMVYSMCGTSFEAGKNFVLNTPGVFGYFHGMRNLPFKLNFIKPAGFYGATGLVPEAVSSTNDLFVCNDADHLYDSPIMYSMPDTATVKVGTADVLISVYSPRKMTSAGAIAKNLKKLLLGAKDYLGGKLPVDKYAFIFYFNGEQPKLAITGAWEHSYSSFYSLEETPEKESMSNWISIAAHEFFHIVTPLTISSKEVKQFNFNETILSKHLWLYEGSTEYYSQHMQAWSGLITPEQFLQSLNEKLMYSRQYMNDSLSFTELSKESAGKHASQYGNVYMKGALINACIDLQLLKLSNTQYGLRQLKHDLGVMYGKDRYFEDDSLFTVITRLTYPEIGTFFQKHVEGGMPINYNDYFKLAGVEYRPGTKYLDFSLGGVFTEPNKEGLISLGTSDLNSLGKQLGYQDGDVLVGLNDSTVTAANFNAVKTTLFSTAKEGDQLTVKVKRKDSKGVWAVKTLKGKLVKFEKESKPVLEFITNPTAQQLLIRNAWLNNHAAAVNAVADSVDVKTLDGITNALYNVISGPAGPRDWNRFRSLFHADAYMAAISDQGALQKFTPEKYIQANGPFLMKTAFTEKEIGRTVNEFGNIAQVFTAYQYKLETTPPESKRGINSIELVKEKGRWYIMSITWDEERNGLTIPATYLKK